MTWPSDSDSDLINLKIGPRIHIVTNLTNNPIIHQSLKITGEVMPRDQSKSPLRAAVLLPQWRREANIMTTFLPAEENRTNGASGGLLIASTSPRHVSTPLPHDAALPLSKFSHLIDVRLSHVTNFIQQYMSRSHSVPVPSLSHVLACPPELHLEKSVPQ